MFRWLKNKIKLFLKNESKFSFKSIESQIEYPALIDKTCVVQYSQIMGKVTLGEKCIIHASRISGTVLIGRNTTINGYGTEINAVINPIKIGSFCSIARNTVIQESNHNINCITTYYILKNIFNEDNQSDAVSKGCIAIGNDVWIGASSVILGGVTIGDGAVIAANSVINKNIPPYAVVGGSPAKIIKFRFPDNIIKKLLEIKWWEWSEEKIIANKNLFYGNLTSNKLKKII